MTRLPIFKPLRRLLRWSPKFNWAQFSTCLATALIHLGFLQPPTTTAALRSAVVNIKIEGRIALSQLQPSFYSGILFVCIRRPLPQRSTRRSMEVFWIFHFFLLFLLNLFPKHIFNTENLTQVSSSFININKNQRILKEYKTMDCLPRALGF